jgi:hypothetical protein
MRRKATSISLPAPLMAWVRAQAAAGGGSISAFIATELAVLQRQQGLAELTGRFRINEARIVNKSC